MQFSLLLASGLVVMVIFLFLRNLSATIIPSLALPISVVGTFAGMSLLGYSLDNLSLMALTLSVGFVVDDAIVMLENIVRHMEAGDPPMQAAIKGAREIGFTILSMTLSLVAVFIPVLFMGGIVGRLLHEFAVTIACAIIVSGLVSLTLTPMLCSRFVHAQHGLKHGRDLSRAANGLSTRCQAGYGPTPGLGAEPSLLHLSGLPRQPRRAPPISFNDIPKDFLPSEDTRPDQLGDRRRQRHLLRRDGAPPADGGRRDPPGSQCGDRHVVGGCRRAALHQQFRHDLHHAEAARPARAFRRPGDPGIAPETGANSRASMSICRIRPRLRIGGVFTKSQYQYTLQSLDLQALYGTAGKLVDALAKTPGFLDVTSDMDLSSPTVNVEIDRDRAASLGISAQQIEQALASSFGSQQISTIYTSSAQYEVILELEENFQRDASALSRLYLRSATGSLVPLDAVVKISHGSSPLTVNHQQELPAVTISFNLPPGRALSQAATDITRVEREVRIAGQRGDQLSGHGPGLPEIDPGARHAAGDGDRRRLHRAGHSL